MRAAHPWRATKRRQAEDSAGLARFVHDGENVLVETDDAGATQVSYTLEPVGYGNLISQRRGSDSAWHHFDALGSTDRLTDAGESELACYVQTAFGVLKATTGSHPNRLRWIGRLGYRWEPDTGQYDVRRRRYDAERGRWISADPTLLPRLAFAYASNSPATVVDPSGLRSLEGFWRGQVADYIRTTLAEINSLPKGSRERQEAVFLFYNALANWGPAFGYPVAASNIRWWLTGKGRRRDLPWDLFEKDSGFGPQIRNIRRAATAAVTPRAGRKEWHADIAASGDDLWHAIGTATLSGTATWCRTAQCGPGTSLLSLALTVSDRYDWHGVKLAPVAGVNIPDGLGLEIEGVRVTPIEGVSFTPQGYDIRSEHRDPARCVPCH